MKKIIALLTLLFVFAFWGKPLTSLARQDVEMLIPWVNNLDRHPGDPNYLSLYYRIRELYFALDLYPSHAVVFFGDSITDDGDWSKLFPNSLVENRGIGGDTTRGLLNRLNQIIAQNPSQIFLMVGTNDLCYGRPIPNIIINYRYILSRLHTELPNTEVYVESVLPFNDTIFPSRSLRTNRNIKELDTELKHLSAEYNYPYLDLASALTNSDGRLPAKYTSDGLHLNDAGYIVWRNQIQNLVSVVSRHDSYPRS